MINAFENAFLPTLLDNRVNNEQNLSSGYYFWPCFNIKKICIQKEIFCSNTLFVFLKRFYNLFIHLSFLFLFLFILFISKVYLGALMISGIEYEYVFVPFETDTEEYNFSILPGF